MVVLLPVYALVFGEYFLRLMDPQPLVPRYVTGGPDGVRANMPDTTFRQWTPEVDVRIHYNHAGMRDDRPPPPLAKAPGECRIALLGDSYFVGFESDWAHSFGHQLERALARHGHPCRVLNFAVSGFGHAEMLVALDSRVRRWRPDLVIASVHQTDGLDNLRSSLFRLSPDGRLERNAASYLPGVAISDRLNRSRFYRWLQENSHLYSAGREWLGSTGKQLLAGLRRRQQVAAEGGGDNAPVTGKTFVGDRQLNRALAQALVAESRAIGAQTLLFDIPGSGGRMRYVSAASDLLGADLLAELPFASPFDRFRAMMGPDVKLYLEHGHRHWTALGNRVTAEVAADAIVARQLLATAPAR
jgi:hypothetical protein